MQCCSVPTHPVDGETRRDAATCVSDDVIGDGVHLHAPEVHCAIPCRPSAVVSIHAVDDCVNSDATVGSTYCVEAPLQHIATWAMLWSHTHSLGCETWLAVSPDGRGLSHTFVFLLLGIVVLVLNIVATAAILAMEHRWIRRAVLQMDKATRDANEIREFCRLIASASSYAFAVVLGVSAAVHCFRDSSLAAPLSPLFIALGVLWGIVSGWLWATRSACRLSES